MRHQRVEEYQSFFSIVAFDKQAIEFYTINLTGQAKEQMGCSVYRIETKFRHRLYIDLWLFTLKFEWIKKVYPPITSRVMR